MGQVLLFLAAVNLVPWALYFLLREPAAEGEVWALFAWLLPTVWSPTIVALLLTRWADGPTGVREALGRLRYPRDGVRWLAMAAAVPATATATAVFVARGSETERHSYRSWRSPLSSPCSASREQSAKNSAGAGSSCHVFGRTTGGCRQCGQAPVCGVCGTSPRSSSQACRSNWCRRCCFFSPWPSQECSWA